MTIPNLLLTVLKLFGVVLRTLFGRLSLVAEEYKHSNKLYGKSMKMMLKACFRGISLKPVLAFIKVAIISAFLLVYFRDIVGKSWFEIENLFYIFSGIGVSMHLLILNAQSKDQISTNLEENQTKVGDLIIWHYYLNYISNKHSQPSRVS